MAVLRTCVIIISVCIISITYAETIGSKTACVGSDVDFFCGINGSLELHIILIIHQSHEIGRYFTDTGVETYPEFQDHYLIVKNMISIHVRITDVTLEDNGTVSCVTTYKTMQTKHEWSLIIQERLASSVIAFKIKMGDPCTVLTCSANSNQLVLKKPDNGSITGTDIVLDSCHHYYPPGEFSCCLMTNCSETECNKITLEDSKKVAADSSKYLWMTLFVIETILAIAVAFVFVCKTRIFKKNSGIASGSNEISKRKRWHDLLRKGQQERLTHNQKDDKSTSGESRKPENTEDSERMLHKQLEPCDSGISTASGSIEMSDTINKRPQSDETINKRPHSDESVESTESRASETSRGSDNLGFTNENTEQIPMVLTKY